MKGRIDPGGPPRLGRQRRVLRTMYIMISSAVILRLHRRALERLASRCKNYIENTFTNLPLTFIRPVLDLICSQWSFFFILKCFKKLGTCTIINHYRFSKKHRKNTQNQWRAKLIPEGRLGKEDRGECFAPYITPMFIIIVSSVLIKLQRKLLQHSRQSGRTI